MEPWACPQGKRVVPEVAGKVPASFVAGKPCCCSLSFLLPPLGVGLDATKKLATVACDDIIVPRVPRFTVYITASSIVPVSDSGFLLAICTSHALQEGAGVSPPGKRQFCFGVELAAAQWVGLCRVRYLFVVGHVLHLSFWFELWGINHKHAQQYNLRRTSSSPLVGRGGLGRGSSAQMFSFSPCEVGTKASVADLYRERVAGRAADGDGMHYGRPGWRGVDCPCSLRGCMLRGRLAWGSTVFGICRAFYCVSMVTWTYIQFMLELIYRMQKGWGANRNVRYGTALLSCRGDTLSVSAVAAGSELRAA